MGAGSPPSPGLGIQPRWARLLLCDFWALPRPPAQDPAWAPQDCRSSSGLPRAHALREEPGPEPAAVPHPCLRDSPRPDLPDPRAPSCTSPWLQAALLAPVSHDFSFP